MKGYVNSLYLIQSFLQ